MVLVGFHQQPEPPVDFDRGQVLPGREKEELTREELWQCFGIPVLNTLGSLLKVLMRSDERFSCPVVGG
jgi:hypothetical protein